MRTCLSQHPCGIRAALEYNGKYHYYCFVKHDICWYEGNEELCVHRHSTGRGFMVLLIRRMELKVEKWMKRK